MTLRLLTWLAILVSAAPVAAQPAKPLFASEEVMHITIRGPLRTLIQNRSSQPLPGALLTANGETLPIALSARGITRKKSEVCGFPPLRVEFSRPPPAGSLFAGQHRLKLVTHCQNTGSFQQYLLLEYAAYKMFNVLTPASFRVRLASIDYQSDDGRPIVSRLGYFLEDTSDLAKRNGLREIKAGDRIPLASLSPQHAARFALFEDMIANHDWSMRAGPAGDECCHNAKLIGASGLASGAVIPVPYDFDFSGLVGAPYAGPPPELDINSNKDRLYRGYCVHNPHTIMVAAEMRAARPQILAALASVPQLDEGTKRRASAFVDQFFTQEASEARFNGKILGRCVN
jgi:hypothetical protein